MYYLWANNAQAGPYTLNQIRAMWNSGQINPTTIYWQEGMSGWSPLSEVLHLIENPAPVREMPRVLEAKRPEEQLAVPAIPLTLAYQWLLYSVFVLALIAFFLPNVSITMPIFGNAGMSMFDLVTTKPDNTTNENSSFSERYSRNTQAPNFWDDVAENKESAGGIICAISLFLLMGHYLLTLIWAALTFAFKKTYDLLTFVWLCLAVQFPILFLIGGQILIGGMKSQMAKDTAGNPFAGLGEAMVASVALQPGLVTWFLTALALGALILLFVRRKRFRELN